MTTATATAYRGSILHTVADPHDVGIADAHEYYPDGILLVRDGDGVVVGLGHSTDMLPTLEPSAEAKLVDYRGCGRLITPGFVDAHVHLPQASIIASYGEQLLQWLQRFVFPAEAAFSDAAHAAAASHRFLDELLRNGTTTALVFCTSHAVSADAFFAAAEARRLRMVGGRVLMDRNAPPALADTADSAYAESAALIRRWHRRARLRYAVTPRFALTSTADQLAAAGRLLREHPATLLHTHVSENADEIAAVEELFPGAGGYVAVYDRYGLIGPRTVLAHGVHLTEAERRRLAEAGATVCFCPTSNMFLGSGLLDLSALRRCGVRVALGSDVGGGTSFSMLRTMGAAYEVCALRGHRLHPIEALYLATLGGARALQVDNFVGSFRVGKEADFVVLDLHATPILQQRVATCQSLHDRLFALMILGDDRCVLHTYSAGALVYSRPSSAC